MTTLLLVVVLLAANAFFVGAEFALVSARRSRMEELARDGSRRAQGALAGMRDITMILAGAQLGIAVASVGLGVLVEPAVEHGLAHWLHVWGLPGGIGRPLAFTVALLLIASAHMTLGEMVPKNITLAGPERAATLLGPPIVAFTRVTRPFLWLFNGLANAMLRLVGIRPAGEITYTYTAEDLASMTRRSADSGMIDAVESGLTQATLTLERRTAAEVMTPWAEVVTVPTDVTPEGLEQAATTSGFTRYPVEDRRVRSYVHLKATLRVPDDRRDQPLAASLLHPLAEVAPDTSLSRLLAQMRRSRSHLALVGDSARPLGIVSFDDVLAYLAPPRRGAAP